MRRMLRPVLAVAAFLLFAPSADAAITASATPAEIKYGQSTTISGTAQPNADVSLLVKYGHDKFLDVNTTKADPGDGSYELADLKPRPKPTYRGGGGGGPARK